MSLRDRTCTSCNHTETDLLEPSSQTGVLVCPSCGQEAFAPHAPATAWGYKESGPLTQDQMDAERARCKTNQTIRL